MVARRAAARAAPLSTSPEADARAPTGMEPRDPAHGGGRSAARAMTTEQAERWIRAVGGALVEQPADRAGRARWVAYVRTPAAPGARSRLIVGLGDSPAAAASMAEAVWHEIWDALGPSH